jgi:GTPase SAR1 family protein
MGCSESKEATSPPPPSSVPKAAPQSQSSQQVPIANISINKNAAIDRQIVEDRRRESKKIKLLLLGTGECGKSTIFKQMRLLYGSPKTDEELKMYGVVVRSNIIAAIRKLCKLLQELGMMDALMQESEEAAQYDEYDTHGLSVKQAWDQVMGYIVDGTCTDPLPAPVDIEKDWVGNSARAGLPLNNDAKLFLQHSEAIRVLWQSQVMQEVWKKRAQANINDSTKNYLDEIPRIASPDYVPTEQDILRGRVRTTQVVCEKYTIDGTEFEVFDVGGQRSERRKWIQCFQGVDAVIFIAALSEYDQTLLESSRVNRMQEALDLFDSIVKNKAFEDKPILLFLNKKDIFADKIMHTYIGDQPLWKDYTGPAQDFDHGVLYFIQKFEDMLPDGEFKDNFIHVTCATDTDSMQFVLDSTRNILLNQSMAHSGF